MAIVQKEQAGDDREIGNEDKVDKEDKVEFAFLYSPSPLSSHFYIASFHV